MRTEAEPPRFTIWACERCDQREALETEEAEADVLRRVASGDRYGTHRCASGALGVTRLLGACSPGWFPGRPYRTGAA